MISPGADREELSRIAAIASFQGSFRPMIPLAPILRGSKERITDTDVVRALETRDP